MRQSTLLAGAAAVVLTGSAVAGTGYSIVDIGLIAPGDAMQGLGVSPGGVGVGRSLGSNQAFMWTDGGGLMPLPNLGSRPFGAANDANDAGVVVGTGATTFFGSSPLPLIWTNGVVAQLPLPAGQTLGRAYGVNASNVAVGSVNGGSLERASIYSGGAFGSASVITATAAGGVYMVTAFAVNDAGLVVGIGWDPNNAARTAGVTYDIGTTTAFEIPPLPGDNSMILFDVGNGGHVVGSSSFNGGVGALPIIWTSGGGTVQIPLPPGTSQGSARGVNASGEVVGIASSAFAVPFYYDGTTTVAVQDLVPAGSGWDVSMNTSSGALGISDDGIIIGTGVFNGDIHAYALVPVVCTEDLDGSGEVDFGDLLAVLSGWGTPAGDVTGDGLTDFNDLLAVLSSWGPC